MQGIYCLTFEGTDKVYIGKSITLCSREHSHLSSLKLGNSPKKLQAAFDTYGTPTFNILRIVEDYSSLNRLEQEYIIEFNSVSEGFNTSPGGEAGALLPGEQNGRALFTDEKYLEILELLVETDYTCTRISEITNTTPRIVGKISCGESHRWLETKYPELYGKLLDIRGLGGRFLKVYAEKRKFNYINSPEGVLYPLDNIKLADFCNEHSLTESKVSGLLNGHTSEYRGWHTDIPPVKYAPPKEVIGPEGTIHTVLYGKYTEFAKANGLDPGAFRKLLKGIGNHHHGWRLLNISKEHND